MSLEVSLLPTDVKVELASLLSEGHELVQAEIVKAMLKESASIELQSRMLAASLTTTPPNVLSNKEGPGGKVLTYVQLGFMMMQMRELISSNFMFRTITAPTLIPGSGSRPAAYTCYLELDVYVYGQHVQTVSASGNANLYTNDNSVDMATKGCVTDAMKKCLSYLMICNDVYQYGDVEPLTDKVVSRYYDDLISQFSDAIVDRVTDKGSSALPYLRKATTISGLRKRYFFLRDKFKSQQVQTD